MTAPAPLPTVGLAEKSWPTSAHTDCARLPRNRSKVWQVPQFFVATAVNLLLGAVVMATGCDDAQPVHNLSCATNSQCPSGWHCDPLGVCRGDVSCSADSQCCLAERCQSGRCRARQACSATANCLDPADQCLHAMCVPRSCSEASECGKGRRCLWGRCHAATPCGGHCGAGQACAVLVGQCVAAAGLGCPSGELTVIANEIERMPEGCAAHPATVACHKLPALPQGDRGLPGQLLAIPGELVHLSYDRTYGDLVIARHTASPPFGLKSVRAIAGVPQPAVIVGDPSGPRGGVAELGPDLGRRLAAMAAKDGTISLVFRDDTDNGLRFGTIGVGDTFSSHAVATGHGIGEQLAIAWSAIANPVVLAFAPEQVDGKPAKAAKIAVFSAKIANPTSTADWIASELDSELVQLASAPCGGSCPQSQVCAADPKGQPSCLTTTAGCAGCLIGQSCVSGKCAQVLVVAPDLDRGSRGRGTSLDLLLLADGTLNAAAYSAASGDLMLYRLGAGQWQKTPVPRSAIPGTPKDFGRFVRLVAGDAGKPWLACEDADRGRLLLIRPTDQGFSVDIADDGVRPDGSHRVGADVAAVRHPFGGVLLAHQDTRRSDLLLQRLPKPGLIGGRAVAESQDIAGFSPSMVQLGSKAWVLASTVLWLDQDGHLSSRVQLRDLVWNGD